MPDGPIFRKRCIIVQQTIADQDTPPISTLVSSPDARVVAIVDRTADLVAAASSIVQARAAFRGRSPYAPDLILVNEFVLKDFTDAAVTAFTRYLSGIGPVNGNDAPDVFVAKPRRREREEVLTKEERSDSGTTIILEGDHGSLVRVVNRLEARF